MIEEVATTQIARSQDWNATDSPSVRSTVPQPPSQYPQIDRRAGLSIREFRREYLYPGKPVVITDAMEGWAANWKWTFDFFRARYGNDRLRVWRYDRQTGYTPEQASDVSLAEYVEGVTSNDWRAYPYYLRDNWRLIHDHPELKQDYEEPKYFYDWFQLLPPFLRMPYPRLFLGPKGAITPLHADVWGTHAWLSQLVGRKRWLLFAPNQKEYLYNYEVSIETPDYLRHPLYRKAQPVEATIGPGDTIFVPSRWAHWVVSLDATISLTSNYMGPRCFGMCLANLSHDLFRNKLLSKLSLRN
jgi:histone arginine demethylase JMJD6